MQTLYIILLIITSYLLGSIPTGLILGKVFKNIDIREHGSGNTGATNAVRVLGFKLGIWAFIFDFLKGGMVMGFLWWTNLEQFYILLKQELKNSGPVNDLDKKMKGHQNVSTERMP